MPPGQRAYTDEDKGAASLVTEMMGGFVKPAAALLEMPRGTLQHMMKRDDPARDAARKALTEHTKVSELAERFLELAKAGADHALANLEKASPYHGALIGAIALDKWALITGRPTSRTEVLRARYVEPGDLRKLSGAVIDVTVTQRGRGVVEGAGPSHLPAGQKRPRRKRALASAVDVQDGPRKHVKSSTKVNDLPVGRFGKDAHDLTD